MQWTELFQFTIENTSEMVIVYETGGQILYANPGYGNRGIKKLPNKNGWHIEETEPVFR